jgi:TonB-dependent starch-binding outer membrane protein SusC
MGSRIVGVLLLVVVMVLPPEGQAQATGGTILGTVLDSRTQRPLGGVQVHIPGQPRGTITNTAGRFQILNVPAGTVTLRTQFIGYAAAEQVVTVTAGSATQVRFEIQEQALALDEVVVTGTAGQARRREVGNAISQVNMDNVVTPVANMDGLLQARAVGMNVQEGSGMAGAGSQIRLRGNVSVALSNQPLVYIDGVRVRSDGYPTRLGGNVHASPLNDINPADIDRIEILKGAAATTLYGTEAAAGVIQIFTKRGAAGAPVWNAQVDQGFNQLRPFGLPDNPYVWMDPWLRRGWRQNYAVSVGGGGSDLQYFVGAGFENNEHVLPNDWEKKLSVRGNFTFSPLDQLQVALNTQLTRHDISNTPAGNNASGLPLNVYRQNANYFGRFDIDLINQVLDNEIFTYIDRLVTGATMTYTPAESFSHRFTVGYDRAATEGRDLRPFGYFSAPRGILLNNRWVGENLTLDYAGTLNMRFRPELRSSFSWGAQSTTNIESSMDGRAENFPGPGLPTLSSGAISRVNETRFRVINAGFFLQNLFDLRDRYFLTVGVRVDGNSTFGESFGLQPYPKVSAAYVLSEEPFWNDRWGQMKLRAAYGHAGRAPRAFDAVRTWTPLTYGDQPAFRTGNVGNPDLGPERTAEVEVGFDLATLDNRLSADFTFYHQRTTDALFNVRQIPSLGFMQPQLKNVGELENRGIELALNASVIQIPRFGWDVGLNVATNRSKLISLGGAAPFSDPSGGSGWYYEGQPVPVIRDRLIRNPDEIAAPVIEPVHFFGPNQPTHTITGLTSFHLPRGILLSARGEYMGGHYIADNASTGGYRRGVAWPTCARAHGLLREGQRDALTAFERAWCIQANVVGTDIYPADFFKLRDISLRLPIGAVVPVTQANNATLTLSARNWYTWKNKEFLMMDPESNNNLGMLAGVRSITEHIPPSASVTASLRVTF